MGIKIDVDSEVFEDSDNTTKIINLGIQVSNLDEEIKINKLNPRESIQLIASATDAINNYLCTRQSDIAKQSMHDQLTMKLCELEYDLEVINKMGVDSGVQYNTINNICFDNLEDLDDGDLNQVDMIKRRLGDWSNLVTKELSDLRLYFSGAIRDIKDQLNNLNYLESGEEFDIGAILEQVEEHAQDIIDNDKWNDNLVYSTDDPEVTFDQMLNTCVSCRIPQFEYNGSCYQIRMAANGKVIWQKV